MNIFVFPSENITFRLQYNSDIYDSLEVRNTINHFELLVKEVMNNPYKPINEINMFTNMDRNAYGILNQNMGQADNKHTLTELFDLQVKTTPDSLAIVLNDESMTYKTLDEQSNWVRNHLIQSGYEKGSRVAVSAIRDIRTVVNLLGVMKAGMVYIPIDPLHPEDRKNFVMENSQSVCLLKPENVKENKLENESVLGSFKPDPHDIAYIIYTSGSTGNPKGVTIKHHSACNTVLGTNESIEVKSIDRTMGLSSFCFDLSI